MLARSRTLSAASRQMHRQFSRDMKVPFAASPARSYKIPQSLLPNLWCVCPADVHLSSFGAHLSSCLLQLLLQNR